MMDSPGSGFPQGMPAMPRSPLPDMSALTMPPTSAFTALLFQRDYVLMLAELCALRTATIGPAALVALIKKGSAPAELSKALTSSETMMLAVFMRAQTYVRETAWAEAALMYRGSLPREEEIKVVPFIKALQAKRMDWSELWSFIDSEKEGNLKGKAAWADPQGAPRTRLQRTLNALSKRFSEWYCV